MMHNFLKALTMGLPRKMAYYAVARGRETGIYRTWAECELQVKGFTGAKYKKFNTEDEAREFLGGGIDNSVRKIHIAAPSTSTASQEFWPDKSVDIDDNELTDDDLLSALNEVEGLPSSKKLKLDTEQSTSKIPRHKAQIVEAAGMKRIGSFDFFIDAEGHVIVYTDGSCIGNGTRKACAGYGVYFGDNHKLNAAKPVEGRVTNNVGEIQAAICAVKTALDLGIQKLCICTDSQFLINSITMWVKGWKQRGWRLSNMEPVKNHVDFKELDDLLEKNKIKVKWTYVEAHKGIKGNEMADKLAKQGSQLYADAKLSINK